MHRPFTLFCCLILFLTGAASITAAELTPTFDPEIFTDGEIDPNIIQQWIDNNGYSYTVGSTSVSHLSRLEKENLCGLVLPDGYVHQGIDFSTIQDPPGGSRAAWDWRDHGGETVVESQSPCGSCWAFGGVHAVAAAFKIAEGYELNLSEQHIVDCNTHGYNCNSGGWMDAVYDLYMPSGYGFVTESCYPYIGGDQSCYQNSCTSMGHIDSYTGVSNNVNSIKSALTTGPVSSAFTVAGSFDYYSGGCYDYHSSSAVNHSMLIVGYDDAMCSGNGAWIVKNSWGTGWGLDGYVYIQYGVSNIGYGIDLVHYTAQTPQADLVYAGHVMDDSGGDGDGYIDPGETVVFEVDLENLGTGDATGVSANLSTLQTDVTIVDNSATWPDIPSGATRTSQSPHFTVTFGPTLDVGTTVTFGLFMNCNEGSYNGVITATVGEVATIFFDDMEGGTNGWTHVQVATQDDWMLGSPGDNSYDPNTAYSGSSIWGNDLAPSGWNGDYASDVHNYLRSPAIDCSGYEGVSLKFMRWLTVEQAAYDQATIYVNGNQVWQNASGSDNMDSSWAIHETDISAYADDNSSVVIEFHMESDSGTEYGGWNIDDFGLYGVVQGSGGCSEDAFEDNDTFGSATTITAGNVNNLKICDGDEDYYRFFIDAGQSVVLDMAFSHSAGNLDLYLYDPSQAMIDSSTSTTNGEQVTAGTVAVSGYYYARAAGVSGAENLYHLTLTIMEPGNTIHADLGCTPESGTLPYTLTLWPQLCNDDTSTRTIHGRIAVEIAGGNVYSNWRSGATNVTVGNCYTGMFNVDLPNYSSLRGDNIFTLYGTDITPPPYNQPPYSPSGGTDTQPCTAVGY